MQRSGPGALDRVFIPLVPLLAALLLNGCSSVAYYGQLAEGQWQLLRARQPVAQVIADPATPPQLRSHLAHAEQARVFASQQLKLPDNRSYRVYADIGRPYVVWNVFATPELSLQPITHCFPIAGCVAYRGYYQQGAARGAAALMRQDGLDVYVGGVEAYSTLGWFDDPILSSMVGWGDERLATLIFHELAHQRFYVQNDTEFNESFASFVEQEGTRQWRVARGLAAIGGDQGQQREQFIRLVLASRERLQAIYSGTLDEAHKRQAKRAEFERLRREYRQVRDGQWGGDKRYDAWVYGPLSNAKLLPFGLYDQWVPAFEALFREVGGDWGRFYERVEQLGRLPISERKAALQGLMVSQ
ncbi:aminopeptidase [Pseudomonas monteilii]|uniref:aminopeptidase n=1 Tax=Pseudomonas TaxID=286 RepID=UPI000488DA49|nr:MULTISPECIES: aminopeptidase [Pseudomonas]MBH3454810.1 aminopeptidase [Pseudomonas monteilii]NBB05261.1 aminopeptidase [Pseudomonas monteilii]PXX69592.1 putative aminopeptidase [Pseudomonas sp. LAIL14HWK12:I1]SMC32624.1 Predicted aminopeptidase [Pseudomonas sp. URIL14HWK12:I5]SOC96826.1 Predicted aminopeptidase [Pseudomonas sp. LAIL14HWK12:I3]